MNLVTVYGCIAIAAMVAFDAFENVSHWFKLAFALACFAASAYAIMTQAWPFAFLEGVWGVISLVKWYRAYTAPPPCPPCP